MKPLIYFAVFLFLIGCASETEQKGLDDIAKLYNAKTSYSKGFNSSPGQETVRQFNVKVSESKLIDSLAPTVTSANIALLVYESLTKSEQEKYNGIEVELVNLKQDTAAYFYPREVLEKISKKSILYKEFSENLVTRDFKKIVPLLSTEILENSNIISGIEGKIKGDSERFGKLISYSPFGISEVADADYVMLQFQGFLNYYNKRIPYFVNINDETGNDIILGFRFTK